MKKIRYCKITILILAGWAILSAIGFLGKDAIYSRDLTDVIDILKEMMKNDKPEQENETEAEKEE